MGVVLEPTAAMGVWRTEVRRESAYLAGNTLVERGTGFALPVADIPCAIAAIDQIVAHPAYTEWQRRHGLIALRADIREWGRRNGYPEIEDRGTLPPSLYAKWRAFREAHSTQAPPTMPNPEPWSTAVAAGWLRLFGPGHYYGGHDGPWSAGIVELTYEVLPAVRTALELIAHQEGSSCS